MASIIGTITLENGEVFTAPGVGTPFVEITSTADVLGFRIFDNLGVLSARLPDSAITPFGGIGSTGLIGATGVRGLQGHIGPSGLSGATGLTGSNGLIGATGLQGPTGFISPYIFDGGSPASTYYLGPAFDCGGIL